MNQRLSFAGVAACIAIGTMLACAGDKPGSGGSNGGSGGGTDDDNALSATTTCRKLFGAVCTLKSNCGATSRSESANICLSYNTCEYDAYRLGANCENAAKGQAFAAVMVNDCEMALGSTSCDVVCPPSGPLPAACDELQELTDSFELHLWFPECDAECVP